MYVKTHPIKSIAYITSIFLYFTSILWDIFAFNEITHRYITEISLKNISKINQTEKYLEKNDEHLWHIIVEYSLKPDEDETEGAFKYHFYNPITEQNFMRENYSAITKFKQHYHNAINYYKKNNKTIAFQELGRAAHFLEDINTPVHTGYNVPSDAISKFPMHVYFEKICDKVHQDCCLKINDNCLIYFLVNSIEVIAKSAAISANDSFFILINDKNSQEEVIAKNSILNAQRYTTGVFYKYFKQMKNNNTYCPQIPNKQGGVSRATS